MATESEKSKFLNNEKDDTILLFTNGEGEPKAINVDRCIEELDGNASPSSVWLNSGVVGNGSFDFASEAARDFVNACPRVPMRPISFQFFNDPSKSSKNFEGVDGIQFTYQVIYKNGSTSAIAPYSNVAYAPQIETLGTSNISEVKVENACQLFIPFVSVEVEAIRIIAREGNDSEPKVIDTLFVGVDTDSAEFIIGDTNFIAEYTFYNDKVGTILSEIDSGKNFDNVPRNAHAQTIADNRVMYGNYTEGYPNIITDVDLSVEFDQAPPPGFSFKLNVEPYTFLKDSNKVNAAQGNQLNINDANVSRWKTNTGIVVDTSDFPETIPTGTYTVRVNVTPQKNYHVFLGVKDKCMYRDGNDITISSSANNYDSITEASGTTGQFNSIEYKTRQTGSNNDQTFSTMAEINLTKSFFFGSGNFPQFNSEDLWSSRGSGQLQDCDLGASYSSPLIIKGESVQLRTVIKVTQETDRDTFSGAVVHGLCGLNPSANPIVGQGSQLSPTWSVNNYFKEYSFDLSDQISQGQSFSADSELADLITSWQQKGTQHPQGFFILSSGTVRFAFEPAIGYLYEYGGSPGEYKYSPSNPNNFGEYQDFKRGYGILMSFAHVEDAVCETVIPTPDFGWGAAASPSSAASTNLSEPAMIDAGLTGFDLIRAKRYNAMGTSKWSTRYNNVTGTFDLAWPGCVRQWMTPDGTLNGPACLQHSDDLGQCFGDKVGGFNLSGSIQPQSSFGQAGFIPTVIAPDDERYHPAPISRWHCIGGEHSDTPPSELSDEFFNSLNGSTSEFKVAIDVPNDSNGQDESDYVIQGRPETMLGDISKDYVGQVVNVNSEVNGRQILRFARDIEPTLPNPGSQFSSYLERGTFSLIDGNGGVGGSNNYNALSLKNRDSNSVWGNPLYMGYHSQSNFESNGVGRMANPRGVVTNFSLLGYKDNAANLTVSEVIHRNEETVGSNVSFGFLDSIVDSYYGASWEPVDSRDKRVRILKEASASDSRYFQDYPVSGVTTQVVGGRDASFYDSGGATTVGAGLSNITYNLTQFITPSGSYTGASLPVSSVSISSDTISSSITSFKTKANHEFGLVYFDERGRHGSVQPLSSVYVPGYDELDRSNVGKGSVSVRLDIYHRPPDWAKHYKVVYSGNTSVREFTQYSAANAFVPQSGPNKNRIYLSLNHLQGNEISYAEGYGAVSQDDGSKNIYRFAEGDRVRILFYSVPGSDSVVYTPEEYEFRVVDFVLLDPDQEDHPFEDVPDYETNEQLNGQFLVLENNEFASGFSVADINSGAPANLWGNRCIFEVYTPFSALNEDARPYYETNYGGRVITTDESGGTLTHEYNTIIISKGDVFYRAVPTNVQTEDSGSFVDIVTENNTTSGTPSQQNFIPYYLETEGLTDLYKSKAKSFGRTHFVDRFADEIDRESSISFSEKTPLGSFEMRYFSFPQIGNFKDLPFSDGAIDRLTFEGTHIMSFNDSRLYKIPVTRDTLTLSGAADDAIVASAKVLGTELAMPFDGGSSGRPESVISINNDFFFFDATNERLVMIQGGKTPVVITESGVNSYFREEVKKWKANGAYKAPSGYDPTRSEYIFTLHDKGDATRFYDAKSDGNRPGADLKMITMGFDLKSKKFWKSRYTYSSPIYANMNECLISFHKEFDSQGVVILPWIHEKNAAKNNFFNVPAKSNICIASNYNPSKVKEYDAMILDSDSRWEANLETKNGSAKIPYDSWRRYNEKWYASIDGTVLGENGFVDKTKSSHTDILTVPFSKKEKIVDIGGSQSVEVTLFLGPKRFRILESEDGSLEFELKIRMPLSATAYGMPLPVGKNTSIILESDPASREALPLGLLNTNAHVYPRRAYVYSENKIEHDNGVVDYSEIVVRMPYSDFYDYCFVSGYQSVLQRISDHVANNGDAEFILDESQNDQVGLDIFDIIFAPFYSMQFGITASDLGGLNQIIAEVDGGSFTLDFAADLNDDGAVSTQDLLIILGNYGGGSGTGSVIGDANNDGFVTSADLLLLLTEFGEGNFVSEDQVDWENLTEAIVLSIYDASRKQLHVAYSSALNTEPLIGRYMKIDLLSDNEDDDAELFEVGVDTDTRVKSVSNVAKTAPAKRATRRAK